MLHHLLARGSREVAKAVHATIACIRRCMHVVTWSRVVTRRATSGAVEREAEPERACGLCMRARGAAAPCG